MIAPFNLHQWIEENRDLTAMDIYKNQNINNNQVDYCSINNFINKSGYLARIK